MHSPVLISIHECLSASQAKFRPELGSNALFASLTLNSTLGILDFKQRQKSPRRLGWPLAWQGFGEIERIAVQTAIAFEEARGWKVESVESDGFDLISRLAFPTNGKAGGTRFIEVKGRSGVGEIALTANEYKTAQRLADDYWLYVVFNCCSQPQVTMIRNPARFDWEPLSKIDCYRIGAETILSAE